MASSDSFIQGYAGNGKFLLMETIPATMIFVLPASIYFFMNGSIEIGTLVICVLLSYASYKPLIKAMSHLETITNIKTILEEINKVMNLSDLKRGERIKNIRGSLRSAEMNEAERCASAKERGRRRRFGTRSESGRARTAA